MENSHILYIGTYTDPIRFGTGEIMQGKGEGIHHATFCNGTGKLEIKGATAATNPSYLALSADNRFIYCVNETKTFENMPGGSASAFEIINTDTLRLINTQPTKGEDPCHISIDSSGKYVFAANFMTGSVSMFPVNQKGELGLLSAFYQHEGKSICPLRQAGPHAHAVVLSPNEKYVLVPDLGIDKIVLYALDKDAGTLTPSGEIALAPGAGPRHCVFHPVKNNLLYVINELSLQVAVIDFDENSGTGKLLQCMPIVKACGPNSIGADIQVTQDGRFLYVSVRGNDILAVLKVDSNTGILSEPIVMSSGGKTPRSFAISPDAKFLLSANQDTNNIVVFSIDQQSGGLERMHEYYAPTPVCLKFAT
ncbi:MAG: lactonase family protein [Oscillospiraceae bacterium]|nr:lactonase family protein [Oscillospiraceae bacterium]